MRSLKILLVLPAGENVRVTASGGHVPRRAMLRFSVLPLATVAGLTPLEHQVRIVDENVEPLEFDGDWDLVGITFMTALAPRAYEIAREFRRRGVTVVGGGYHPTLCPEDAAAHFDALVLGDAEPVWALLLEDLKRGDLKRRYGGSTVCHGAGGLGMGTVQTARPRRELLEPHRRHYATLNAVQAGRGCRHACRYCSVARFHGQQYHHRTVQDVLDEIRNLKGDFIFVDDNIIADREFSAELFKALAPLGKRWVSQSSILIADDPELLRLAHEAGCRGLFIGIETANEENLAMINKRFNDATSYADRIAAIRRSGIGVIAGIIVGMDNDNRQVFENTLRFLLATGVDALQLNILTPLPGTPLFRDYADAGRLTDRDWTHYDYRHVVFEPSQMSRAELQAGADWLYAQFYRLDRVLWRFAKAVFKLGWMPAWLGLKLGLTYRYDNRRQGIRGWNPARCCTPRVARWSCAALVRCLQTSREFLQRGSVDVG